MMNDFVTWLPLTFIATILSGNSTDRAKSDPMLSAWAFTGKATMPNKNAMVKKKAVLM